MSRAAENMWSRRRAAVLAEAEQEQAQVQTRVQTQARAEVEARQAGKSDQEILKELNLKDPDQMQGGDDFAAFLRDEVPAHLRKRALRVLWRSNPVLACVDDLVDYGNDFKAEALEAQVFKTAYRVGKGMLAHIEEMEAQQAAIERPPAPEAEDEEAPAVVQTQADDIVAAVTDEVVAPPILEPEQPDDPTPHQSRRRMRFEFEGVA